MSSKIAAIFLALVAARYFTSTSPILYICNPFFCFKVFSLFLSFRRWRGGKKKGTWRNAASSLNGLACHMSRWAAVRKKENSKKKGGRRRKGERRNKVVAAVERRNDAKRMTGRCRCGNYPRRDLRSRSDVSQASRVWPPSGSIVHSVGLASDQTAQVPECT